MNGDEFEIELRAEAEKANETALFLVNNRQPGQDQAIALAQLAYLRWIAHDVRFQRYELFRGGVAR